MDSKKMNDFREERRALRVKTHFEALYATGREDGTGILVDVSYSGARLDRTSVQPKVGTLVRLYITFPPARILELVGHVVRHAETGFAIEYESPPDDTVRGLVDDAAAVVRTVRRPI